MSNIEFRIYADGGVVHEDDFAETDNGQPFRDDYNVVSVPDVIVEHIENQALGK